MTIAALKHKLASHTGTAAEDIVGLTLLDSAGAVVARLDSKGDETKLGFFSPGDGFCLRFDDNNPCSLAKGGWLEDTSLVQKYEMNDETYDRREGTFREFARKRREQDPGWTLEKEMSARRNGGAAADAPSCASAAAPRPDSENSNPLLDGDYQRDLASSIEPGDRCEVNPGGKRALVRFVGNGVESLTEGFWVGVEYDEPVGKNDGRPPKSEASVSTMRVRSVTSLRSSSCGSPHSAISWGTPAAVKVIGRWAERGLHKMPHPFLAKNDRTVALGAMQLEYVLCDFRRRRW